MIRRISKIALGLVALICVGLAILAVRLSMGPLSANFLVPTIVNALEPEDGSFRVSIDGAALSWQRSPGLRAVGVRITDPMGDVRATIPELTMAFSGRALLRAELAPTSLEIVGPRLTVVRREDGSVRMTDPPPGQQGGAAREAPVGEADHETSVGDADQKATVGEADGEARPQVSGDFAGDVLSDILAPPGPSNKLGYLTSLSIRDADVTLVDRKLDVTWRAPSSTAVLLRGENGLQLQGTFGLDIGGKTAGFSITGEYNTEIDVISGEVQLVDIEPDWFASTAPLFEPLAGIKLPLNGVLRARVGFDGTVQLAGLDVKGGEGTLLFPGEASDAARPVRSLRLRGELTDDLKSIQLDEFNVDLSGPVIAAIGSVQGVTPGVLDGPFELAAELSLRDLTVGDITRLWPLTVAETARHWVMAHLADGTIPEGKVSVSGIAGESGVDSFEVSDMAGDVRFMDMGVTNFDAMPPVRRVHGTATLSKDTMTVAITGGDVQGLTIDSGKIAITGLNDSAQSLDAELVARGAVRNVLTILDRPPLGYVSSMNIRPSDVGGDAALRMQIRMPLSDAVTFTQADITAAATLRGISLPKAVSDLDLSRGNFTLQLDSSRMDLEGTGVLGTTPVTLTWSENFAPRGFSRRFNVRATLDNAARRSLGLDLGDTLRGPVGIDAEMTQFPSNANSLTINADVTRAVIDINELSWRKEAGAVAWLTADVALTGETPTAVRSFTLDGAGATVAGEASFAADGKTVNSVKLSQVRLGRSDFLADVTRMNGGGYDIWIRGRSLDVSRLLRSENTAPARDQVRPTQTDLVPLTIALSIANLHVTENGTVTNVSARMRRDWKQWQMIMIDGRPSAGGLFSINLAPDGANRTLRVRSDDAGSILRVLNINENIVGGRLQVDGRYDDSRADAPLTATLEVTNFRLVRAPVIARLLSVALLTGIRDSLRGEGIGFDRLQIPFTLRNDLIETRGARAHGPAFGMTAEGWVNLANNTVGLRGTLVPAHSVNSALGNIPLLGRVFTGRDRAGMFAATYRMIGSLDDPIISVNPLSTLAPGFLRNLFGVFEGGVPRRPEDIADPSAALEPPVPLPPLSRE